MRTLILGFLLVLPGCRNKDDSAADTSDPTVTVDTRDTDDTDTPTGPVDADGDGWTEDVDCDDDDASVQGPTTWYVDGDGDGWGSDAYQQDDCVPPDGFADNAEDCDDEESTTHPGAVELCDGDDNDCNGAVDDSAADAGQWYADSDGDGFGDAASATASCDGDSSTVADASDCDDSDAAIHPDAEEVCDGTDNDCDALVDDDDPGLGDADTWYDDTDGDGYGDADDPVQACEAPGDRVADSTDCDDADAAAHPGATEICDGGDNDCDGLVDDDDPDVTGTTTWYLDADADGYGRSDYTFDTCTQPSGTSSNALDCDDGDASALPGGTEVCDGADNDCDGTVDGLDATDGETWYADDDGDGYGDPGDTTQACELPSGHTANAGDCDDGDASVNPGGVEVCDGIDNDCNTWTDSDDPGVTDASTVWYDADGDGHGTSVVSTETCASLSGYVDNDDDCDDLDASISPDGTEVCDSVDNDCDGDVDDDDSDVADPATWYADSDGDGWGDETASSESCEAPSSTVDAAGDCDDGDAAIHPDAAEACDGVDNDCDGDADAGSEGSDAQCSAASCQAVLDAGASVGDGLYWLDPDQDGDTSDAWQAWCDMTTDDGGWTRLFSSHYPTFWTPADWDDSGVAVDDDYSVLLERAHFVDSAGWITYRLEVGNSDTWNTGTRAHYTVWEQGHDAFDDTTDGSDYLLLDGEESTTCDGFNGLHDRHYSESSGYSFTSDVDSGDSTNCWWQQIVPILQYEDSASYPGYLEGYDSYNVHTWQTLWVR